MLLLSWSPAMALMIASSTGARPFGACYGGFRSPSSSLCSGLEMVRLRGRASVVRISYSGNWRTTGSQFWTSVASAPGDYSSAEPTEEQEDFTKSANTSFWKNWQLNAGDLKDKIAKLGRSGLLAYGLFNGITYTAFFFIAFLAFEKTGQNPANNLKACLGGMVSMWTGNNFTRPLRLAAAAALAPVMDKVLKKTQKVFKLADEASAFLFLAIALWVVCLAAVGLLILSRMGR